MHNLHYTRVRAQDTSKVTDGSEGQNDEAMIHSSGKGIKYGLSHSIFVLSLSGFFRTVIKKSKFKPAIPSRIMAPVDVADEIKTEDKSV
jgi:hypothetical protein